MQASTKSIISKALNPITFYLYKLKELPSLWFWGVKVAGLDLDKCVIEIPYGWRTKNPFKTGYFAALGGAAELSTGMLLYLAKAELDIKFSMYVIDFNMKYSKSATSKTQFTCTQGSEILRSIQSLTAEKPTTTIILKSTGISNQTEVCQATITWAIKLKP